MTVYVPTLSRYGTLKKTIPAWLEQEQRIILVTDPDEFEDHVRLRDEMGWVSHVRVVSLPKAARGYGIGYKRNFIVDHADNSGHRSIIIADDDHKPVNGTDTRLLLREARRPGVLGIGAVIPIYDRFTGGRVSKLSGPILCPGGWGFAVYGLNVDLAISVGNYDPLLTVGEDAELWRNGVEAGIPWRVHCDVKVAAVGKRNSPGGMTARWLSGEERARAERESRALIYERWPDYASPPELPFRMRWAKMLDDYIPGWRERSALHGGSL